MTKHSSMYFNTSNCNNINLTITTGTYTVRLTAGIHFSFKYFTYLQFGNVYNIIFCMFLYILLQ